MIGYRTMFADPSMKGHGMDRDHSGSQDPKHFSTHDSCKVSYLRSRQRAHERIESFGIHSPAERQRSSGRSKLRSSSKFNLNSRSIEFRQPSASRSPSPTGAEIQAEKEAFVESRGLHNRHFHCYPIGKPTH